METLFRFHRGGLAESLETTVFVTGRPAIRKYIKDTDPIFYASLSNIRIMKEPYVDERLPKEWGSIEYMVVADFEGYKGISIGFTNFLN
jgi:hypothetical protein